MICRCWNQFLNHTLDSLTFEHKGYADELICWYAEINSWIILEIVWHLNIKVVMLPTFDTASMLWREKLGILKLTFQEVQMDFQNLMAFLSRKTEGKIHLYSGSWNTLGNDMGTNFKFSKTNTECDNSIFTHSCSLIPLWMWFCSN